MNKSKFLIAVLGLMVASLSHAANVPSESEMTKVAKNIKVEYEKQANEEDKKKYRESIISDLEKQASSSLPVKMSEDISWEKMKTNSNKITYSYKVSQQMSEQIKQSQSVPETKVEFKKSFSEFLCTNPIMKTLLDIGIKVELEYLGTKNEKVIPNLSLNKSDCKN